MLVYCVFSLFCADKVPHFSRLGDVEVNAGQNATFQCVATGRSAKTDPFMMEVSVCVCLRHFNANTFLFLNESACSEKLFLGNYEAQKQVTLRKSLLQVYNALSF